MQEIERRLDALELRLLNEVTEAAKNEKDIWESIDKLTDLMANVIKDVKELRTDVNNLIENSCGCKKSA